MLSTQGISSTLMIVFIGLGADGSSSIPAIATIQEPQNDSFGMRPTCTQSNTSSDTTQLPLLENNSNQLHIPEAEFSKENAIAQGSVEGNRLIHPYLLKYHSDVGNPTTRVSRKVL